MAVAMVLVGCSVRRQWRCFSGEVAGQQLVMTMTVAAAAATVVLVVVRWCCCCHGVVGGGVGVVATVVFWCRQWGWRTRQRRLVVDRVDRVTRNNFWGSPEKFQQRRLAGGGGRPAAASVGEGEKNVK
nr:hypothetical protein [Tanacetum cinerariifolium]